MASETVGQSLSGWQDLTTALAANAAELPHLETRRVLLADMLKQAQDLTAQQAALAASKQEVSKKLQAVLDQGRKAASFLRLGVKQNYGTRSEKLAEFRLPVFRGRAKAAAPAAAGGTTPSNQPPATAPTTPPATTPSTTPSPSHGAGSGQ